MTFEHLYFKKLFERNNVSKSAENYEDDIWDVEILLMQVSSYLKVIMLYYSTNEQVQIFGVASFFSGACYCTEQYCSYVNHAASHVKGIQLLDFAFLRTRFLNAY
jgi:hypothetical protein